MTNVNLNEAIQAIKNAGPTNVRAVPMAGQNINSGNYQIDIMEGSSWKTVVSMIPEATARNLIAQATNRTICG